MKKTLRLELNEYRPIPVGLRQPSAVGVAVPELSVDLANLYHHYYLDTHGRVPPSPDPAHFEHVRFLTPDPCFRFLRDGLGASTSARRAKSAELGQAFCRLFLHDYLGVSYFAHISELLDRQAVRELEGCRIERVAVGDAPDYLCATNRATLYLGEAKGRYTSIGFRTREFQRWRDQFSRVRVLDASGAARTVKGHVVATRFATERASDRIQSTIFAEDPDTEGDGPLGEQALYDYSAIVMGMHYSRLAEKLDQPLLAAALWNGIRLPEEIMVPVTLWQLHIDPIKDRLFVGGYYAAPTGGSYFDVSDDGVPRVMRDPFRLDRPRGTFVGVEFDVFRKVVEAVRTTGRIEPGLPEARSVEPIYSAISLLRDGSALGPIEFFSPVNTTEL